MPIEYNTTVWGKAGKGGGEYGNGRGPGASRSGHRNEQEEPQRGAKVSGIR